MQIALKKKKKRNAINEDLELDEFDDDSNNLAEYQPTYDGLH